MTTVQRIIDEENPVIVALVETKLRDGETIDLPGFKILRTDRDEEGGGVMLAVKNTLSHIIVWTNEYKQNGCEMVWIKIDNGKVKINL